MSVYPTEHTFDFAIIGSGFGGSVSAMRLAQKGYQVVLIEKGKRYNNSDFPKTNWIINKFIWAPIIKCFGIQQITLLKGVMVLHGSGVGGGSLVYANTLMKPLDSVFTQSSWPGKINWKDELSPHYETAQKMLGATLNQIESEADLLLKELGQKMNVSETYHPTEVGIYFGKSGQKVPDPYFQGHGPERTGCTGCGACMIGCRVGAKNTLDKNYLYFAEKWGTKILPELQAKKIIPLTDSNQKPIYKIETKSSTHFFKNGPTIFAQKVILAAGVLGTVDLLFKNKEIYKTLPKISNCLGDEVRTNGESLCGATSFDTHRDLSRGIAIGSAIHPNSYTKIEPVRYPSGSDIMKFLAVPLTADGNKLTRPLKLFKNIILNFNQYLRTYFLKDWAKSTIILLVMQSIDQKMKLKMGRSIFNFFRQGLVGDAGSQKIPSYIPLAQEASQKLANSINGQAQNVFTEVLLGTPATAHILGGCCIGENKETSVINHQHEVFDYPGLYICDGSVVPANLGVNPSLTITAMAERFSAQFPASNTLSAIEADQRKIRYS